MAEPILLQCLSIRIKITDTHPIINQNVINFYSSFKFSKYQDAFCRIEIYPPKKLMQLHDKIPALV